MVNKLDAVGDLAAGIVGFEADLIELGDVLHGFAVSGVGDENVN